MKNKIKYLIFIILFIFTFFSSIYTTNAGILNINYGVEKIEYTLSNLPKRNFNKQILQEKYNKMRKLNKILTQKLYKEYRKGNVDYYTTRGMIQNHKIFIYQISKLFDYFEIKFKNKNNKIISMEIDEKIINSYSNIRTSYKKINYLIKR